MIYLLGSVPSLIYKGFFNGFMPVFADSNQAMM
jgi:hypothetical protein